VKTVSWLVLLISFAVPVFAQSKECKQFVFGGELSAGETFARDIGNGLTFRMTPSRTPSGWEFEIGPTTPANGEWDQYVYTLTPPYRSSNAREVNTGWGTTAQDAVKWNREFWFLISRADAPAAAAALDSVLWPKSEKEQEGALRKLASFPAGKGDFSTLDSKITPGTDCNAGHCGEIHWINFQITLVVPDSFQPATDLQVAPVQCPASSGLPRSKAATPSR
jgi:hypothetical protein